MHKTALLHARLFFETYVQPGASIVEIGSQDVNGSIRSVAPEGCPYTGADFVEGRGVDVVLDDPYKLPFSDGSFDICVSSSCFEHSEFFWLAFLEAVRIVRTCGLIYLNVPSNGSFHRFPVDCWRFYPDSGRALERWARRNDEDVTILESFTGSQHSGIWNDYVAVFAKGPATAPHRCIQDRLPDHTNGYVLGREGISNYRDVPQDQRWKYRLKRLAGWKPS